MFSVVFDVFVVVDDVNAAGDAAEGDESVGNAEQFAHVQEFAGEEKWDKKEEIFCPIFGSQEFEIGHSYRVIAATKYKQKGENYSVVAK
jgi:hypothetical protein